MTIQTLERREWQIYTSENNLVFSLNILCQQRCKISNSNAIYRWRSVFN